MNWFTMPLAVNDSASYLVRFLLAKRDMGCAEAGEMPNFSEDELLLSAKIASFLTR